jgi:hypothetical protein
LVTNFTQLQLVFVFFRGVETAAVRNEIKYLELCSLYFRDGYFESDLLEMRSAAVEYEKVY